MNLNTALMKIVGILVALIITLSVAVPIISNLGGDSTTIYGQNTPLNDIRYTDATEGEHIVTLDIGGVATVDGEDYLIKESGHPLIQTDNLYVSYDISEDQFKIGFVSSNGHTSTTRFITGPSTITFQNGTAHIDTENSGSTPIDLYRDYEWLILPNINGNYCFASLNHAHIGPEQNFYIGYTSAQSYSGDLLTYKYSDGQFFGTFYSEDSKQFETPDAMEYSIETDENGMIEISDIKCSGFNINSGIFPLEYGIISEGTDDPVMDLIQIVPLLLIIGLVVATIATIVMYRTND